MGEAVRALLCLHAYGLIPVEHVERLIRQGSVEVGIAAINKWESDEKCECMQ